MSTNLEFLPTVTKHPKFKKIFKGYREITPEEYLDLEYEVADNLTPLWADEQHCGTDYFCIYKKNLKSSIVAISSMDMVHEWASWQEFLEWLEAIPIKE